jgi:hypothetical protein
MVTPTWVPIIGGSIPAIGCLAGAFVNLRKKRTIDDLPTSKTQGVFIGLTELKGTAESENPFTSYLAEIQCVEYKWQVEEHWQRTVTETYTDSKGHVQTRTRTESGWKTIASGGQSAPFFLKDDSGVIMINSAGARVEDKSVYGRTCSRGDPLYYAKGPPEAIAHSTYQRRFQETAIPLHEMLYVLGKAHEREDIVAPEIALDKNEPFLISIRSEKQISSGYGIWFWSLAGIGLLLALGGAAGWGIISSVGVAFYWLPLMIMGVGYIFVILAVYGWATFNSLINLHHRVEQGWSQIEVQLKRRHDLIPNLVQTVASYRQYEKETQTLLAELRNQMEVNASAENTNKFQGLSPQLRVVAEKYPELKANELFLKLQHSLVDTEQRLALARDYYNDIATFYNTRLGIIPDRYVAKIAGLRSGTLLTATDFERAPVVVNLASG